MPKDLLDQIRGPGNNPVPTNMYENDAFDSMEADNNLDSFLLEVGDLQDSIKKIGILTAELRNKHSEILSAPQQNNKMKQEIMEHSAAIEQAASKILTKLKQMGESINQMEQLKPGSSTVKSRRTQHFTVTKQFMDTMNNYRMIQMDYQKACKEQIKLKLEIAEHPKTDEELEQMLESDNPQIFTEGILVDTQQARQNVADIKARHDDIMKLEKSIRELRDLFIDPAAMVEAQNELIDRIDYNVSSTKDHVETAKFATKKAVEYRKKSRKKKIIIISVVVGVVVLLIIILIATLVKR